MGKELNVKLEDRGNTLLPLTTSDNIELRGFEPLKQKLGLIDEGENINGMTLTAFISKGFLGQKKDLRFLHLSDTHFDNCSIKKADELLKADPELKFAIITGDLQLTAEMKQTIAVNEKIYVMLGNHDTSDDFGNKQKPARDGYIAPYMTTRAVMGDDENIGSWWYKDIDNIRLISFDEYEYDRVGGSSYVVKYSRKQIDWFIDLLKSTPSDMYIILAHHQPVSVNRDASDVNLFVSEKAPNNYEFIGGTDAALITVKIMEAYLNRERLTGTFNPGEQMNLDVDFSQIQPAHFIGHIAGHTHWDVCGYLPLYPKQLQLVIDEGRATKYTYSDLNRSKSNGSDFCINEYAIDFASQRIKIKRIGAHVTDGGQNRNNISFSFRR